MKLRPSHPLAVLATVALACGADDPDASGTTEGTGGPSTSATMGSSATMGTQTQGPSTTASTTDPDVTGDPTGPDDSESSADSSSGEPIDPPTEPEIMLERPPGSFFENIARLPDGSILVTDHTMQEVLRMTPTGDVEVFASLDDWPFSIAIDSDGSVIIASHLNDVFDDPTNFVTDNVIYVADGQGGVDLVAEVPDATYINGIALLEPGVILAADSTAATVWRIDIGTGDVSPWLQHMLLNTNGTTSPGANGIKVRDGVVWISNTVRMSIVRVPLVGSAAGTPEVYFSGRVIDDFAIAESGTIYATSHGMDVFTIGTDLVVTSIAGPTEGVVGNTAAVFGGSGFDDRTIYVSTDGGLFTAQGNANNSGPARIVRLPVGELGD